MTSKNNWFEISFNGRTKENLGDFQIKLNPYQYVEFPTNFQDAVDATLLEISNLYPKLYLAFSGGIYSEYLLHRLVATKIKFVPIILESQFNKYEFEMADIVCERMKITPWVISISKNNLIDRLRALTYEQGLYSFEGGIPLILAEEVEKLGGHLLTGTGHCFDYPLPRGTYYRPFYHVFDYFESDFYVETQRPIQHPGGFYKHSLELYQAMWRQTNWGEGVRGASIKLLDLNHREKIYLDDDFYKIAGDLYPFKTFRHKCRVDRDSILAMLNKFKS